MVKQLLLGRLPTASVPSGWSILATLRGRYRHFSDVTDYADDVRSWGKPFVPLDGTTGILQENAKHFPTL